MSKGTDHMPIKKPFQKLQKDNADLRAQKKFAIISKKGLREDLMATYRGKKARKIEKITSAGLIFLEGARTPIDPADCELALQ